MKASFVDGMASVFMVMPVTAVEQVKPAKLTIKKPQDIGRYWASVGRQMSVAAVRAGDDIKSKERVAHE